MPANQMIIYPAIDLIGSRVVRLSRGDYEQKTEYSDDPAAIAKKFEAAGAEYLHVVDLDGAKAKKPINSDVLKQIAESINVPIQFGGGIRSAEAAEAVIKYAERLIIGTVALTDTNLLKKIINALRPDKIVVSIDYKSGKPAINGWLEPSPKTTEEIQASLKTAAITRVIVTDIAKDGLLAGPNIELMKEWKQAGFEVICAGGVSSIADIVALKSAGIDGAIIGKALYEGKIDLSEAISAGR